MKFKEAEAFLQSASNYCTLIELLQADNESTKLNKLLVALSELYFKALDLPNVDPKNCDVASFDNILPQVDIQLYDRYWKVFDPFHLEEPVSMSLIDDILDIYKDVKEGILLYEHGEHIEAIWHWKFNFEVHWGRHAINAICALHSAIYSNIS